MEGHYNEIKETKKDLLRRLDNLTVSKNSKANNHSYAKLLLNQASTGNAKIAGTGSEDRGLRIFLMDGPNKNHMGDWNKFIKHPEYSKLNGKYFFYLDVPGKVEQITEKEDGPTISEKCLIAQKHR